MLYCEHRNIHYNPMAFFHQYAVFIIPIIVGITVQLIKFALFTYKHGWQPEYLFTHGHMPSAHTALAISLVTSIGFFEGIGSGSFAIAVVVAFIIFDDAVRIRMILGDQGRYFNMLIDQLKGEIDENKFPRLKERVGHRTNEVIVGATLGFFFTVILIALAT